jgi:hypothetical protein
MAVAKPTEGDTKSMAVIMRPLTPLSSLVYLGAEQCCYESGGLPPDARRGFFLVLRTSGVSNSDALLGARRGSPPS